MFFFNYEKYNIIENMVKKPNIGFDKFIVVFYGHCVVEDVQQNSSRLFDVVIRSKIPCYCQKINETVFLLR